MLRAMVSAGSVRCHSVSMPPLPGPAIGKSLSCTPSTSTSMMASQNEGMPRAAVKSVADALVDHATAPRRGDRGQRDRDGQGDDGGVRDERQRQRHSLEHDRHDVLLVEEGDPEVSR